MYTNINRIGESRNSYFKDFDFFRSKIGIHVRVYNIIFVIACITEVYILATHIKSITKIKPIIVIFVYCITTVITIYATYFSISTAIFKRKYETFGCSTPLWIIIIIVIAIIIINLCKTNRIVSSINFCL